MAEVLPTRRDPTTWRRRAGDPGLEARVSAVAGLLRQCSSRVDVDAFPKAPILSPREVLLGLDPQRGVALESALGQQKDLPRADEWIRANLRWFEQLRDDPGSAGVRTEGESSSKLEIPWPLKPLGWVGLGKMRDRIAFCRQYVWY